MRNIYKIGETPLSIALYSVNGTRTHICEDGVLEIIFCLKGSVKVSYVFEEFTLKPGEYISVDKDAYYLYDGKENICASFFIDMHKYEDKYPFICSNLFICEGVENNKTHEGYNQMLGMLIAMLKHIVSQGDETVVAWQTDHIMELFVSQFDSYFYRNESDSSENMLERLRKINVYMRSHFREPIAIKDLIREINLTENYISEYLGKTSVGFRSMLNYIRANESQKYLLYTCKSIVEISELCGFSDVRYYYKAFRQWYGCTPGQFRVKYGKNRQEKIKYLKMDEVKDIVDEMLEKHYMEMFMAQP